MGWKEKWERDWEKEERRLPLQPSHISSWVNEFMFANTLASGTFILKLMRSRALHCQNKQRKASSNNITVSRKSFTVPLSAVSFNGRNFRYLQTGDCKPMGHATNLSNLLFFLLFDLVGERVVVTFYDDQIVTLMVESKFPRRVAKRCGYLVKHST